MTTITIKNGDLLPQQTFDNWEELRNVLNFMSLQLQQTEENSLPSEKINNKPLTSFNYLTDENL